MRTIVDFDTLEKLENVLICVVPKNNEHHYDDLHAYLPGFRLPIVKVSSRYEDVIRRMEYDPDEINEPFIIFVINGSWVAVVKRISVHVIREMEKHYLEEIVL
jgi:hypothetical protein